MRDVVVSANARVPMRSASRIKPAQLAALIVLAYLAVSALYIWLSGVIAASIAHDVAELQQLELYKGMIFIAVSAVLLFGALWLLFRVLASREVEILRQRDALIEAERRAVAGVFASSIGHDINNILTVLGFYADTLKEAQASAPQVKEASESLGKSLEDLGELAERLLGFGRKGMRVEFTQMDLAQTAREVVAFAKAHKSIRRCTLRVTGDESVIVRGNPTMMRQLLLNLILNSAEAAGGSGQIDVNVRREKLEAVIEVHDSGPGIPLEERETIFKAFFTSKEAGAGLGLMSVKAYVSAHRGSIEVGDSHLGGACFRISLPIGEL